MAEEQREQSVQQLATTCHSKLIASAHEVPVIPEKLPKKGVEIEYADDISRVTWSSNGNVRCPYCGETFELRDAIYSCTPCKRILKSSDVVESGWWFLSVIRKIPRPVHCKKGHRNPKRLCPNPECQKPIPNSVGIWGCNLLLAVMGMPKSGKTIFWQVLSQQIDDICKQFGMFRHTIGDKTRERENEAEIAIRSGKLPEKIREGTAAQNPNLYALRKDGRVVVYAFYDSDGDEYTAEKMETSAPYVPHLDGFIFLINPLALPKVRKDPRIHRKVPVLPPEDLKESTNTRGILDSILDVCHNPNDIQKKFVAVCLSRSDLLEDLFPPGNRLMEDGGHQGFFNVKDHEENSRIIGDLLEDWLDPNIRQRLSIYKDHAFFAISALGGNPDENGELPHAPQPIRVADPFLWLLWKEGFIQEKRSKAILMMSKAWRRTKMVFMLFLAMLLCLLELFYRGIVLLMRLPLFILRTTKIISANRQEIIVNSRFFKLLSRIITCIITFVSFVGAIIAIVTSWEHFVRIITNWVQ